MGKITSSIVCIQRLWAKKLMSYLLLCTIFVRSVYRLLLLNIYLRAYDNLAVTLASIQVSVRSRKGRIVPRIIARAAEAILLGVRALADYHWLLTATDPSKYTCLCSECLEFVV